jgi:hypothetical protein
MSHKNRWVIQEKNEPLVVHLTISAPLGNVSLVEVHLVMIFPFFATCFLKMSASHESLGIFVSQKVPDPVVTAFF